MNNFDSLRGKNCVGQCSRFASTNIYKSRCARPILKVYFGPYNNNDTNSNDTSELFCQQEVETIV